MPKIPIFDPTKGMFTAADQQDFDPKAGYADLIENYYLDRPGKIRMRDILDLWVNNLSTKTVKGLFRFVDENLTGNAEWIAYVALSGTDRIWAAASATFAEKVSGLTEVTSGKLDITVVAGKLRLAFGYTSQKWYGYNDINDFFQNQYQPASAWAWLARQPSYPAGWSYGPLEPLIVADPLKGTGVIGPGYAYYKVVPVFDGVQEAIFASDKAFCDSTGTIAAGQLGILRLKIIFNSGNWIKRITHLNIYRYFDADSAADDDALYQKVDTVSVRNEDAQTTISDADVLDKKLYDGSKSWGVDDYVFVGTGTITVPDVGDIKYTLELDGTDYDIASNTATIITCTASFSAKRYFRYSYTISKYICAIAGSWPGTAASTEDTGTDGWGGRHSWYSSASSFADSEIQFYIVHYDTEGIDQFGVIVENNDKVLVLSFNSDAPVVGSGLSVIYAKYLYFKSGDSYRLYWCDYGRLNKGAHPLAGVTTITSAPKYSVFWKGRLFGLNTRVTNADATTEDFPDALVYTEVGQMDVWPADFQLQPPTDQGGIGQGIEVIEEIETLVLFYRNNIEFLKVPLADPDSWRMWSSTAGMGLVNPDAKIKTPVGIFFCSDEGVYLINRQGNLMGPVSFPIDDSYKSAVATGVTKFSAIYYPQQRQVWLNLATAKTTAWVLDIDSIVEGRTPRWSTYTWTARTVHLSALSESNVLHLFDYGAAGGTSLNRIGAPHPGDESTVATFRTAYMPLGSMQRLHLIRRAIIGHKGVRTITPTVYLNDGASSEAKTAIAASANGEHKKVTIKRYARNFALQLATNGGTNINHEISGIEMEIGNE